MRILISNDDGYLAPGLSCLADELAKIAEIIIIAPDRNRSGASNSLTLDAPMRVREVQKNVYYVNGTPTDCVHLGITGLLKKLPDMVVSGINGGSNLGDDVIYSGTVAAAMEGRFLGLPSIALSLNINGEAKHYHTAALVAKDLVQRLQGGNLPPKTILNVNIPDIAIEELGGYEVTRLGTRHCAQPSIKQVDPRGHEVYWTGLPGDAQDAGPGTDFYAVSNGNVSITPLQIEWTNYQAFEHVASWVHGLDASLNVKAKK